MASQHGPNGGLVHIGTHRVHRVIDVNRREHFNGPPPDKSRAVLYEIYDVEVYIDQEKLAKILGARAAKSKRKVATCAGGAVAAAIVQVRRRV